jgi:hypothetical protein
MNDSYEVAVLEEPTAAIGQMRLVSAQPAKIEFKWTVLNQTVLEPNIELFNIAFNIQHSDEHVFVVSPQWPSLRTYGKTAREAIADMVALIRHVTREYVFVPESELAEDAIEFRKFLMQRLFA